MEGYLGGILTTELGQTQIPNDKGIWFHLRSSTYGLKGFGQLTFLNQGIEGQIDLDTYPVRFLNQSPKFHQRKVLSIGAGRKVVQPNINAIGPRLQSCGPGSRSSSWCQDLRSIGWPIRGLPNSDHDVITLKSSIHWLEKANLL
jgi:hypothetical protein